MSVLLMKGLTSIAKNWSLKELIVHPIRLTKDIVVIICLEEVVAKAEEARVRLMQEADSAAA